jgi:hypothetical protein
MVNHCGINAPQMTRKLINLPTNSVAPLVIESLNLLNINRFRSRVFGVR